MRLTSDEHSVQIGDSTVSIEGDTGKVHATWTLLVDGRKVDTAKAAGDFRLQGELPDGTAIEAAVHQSLLGPTRVVIFHQDEEVTSFKGFVA